MTSTNMLIVDHNFVEKGLKVIDCIILSAEYWCPNNGTHLKSHCLALDMLMPFLDLPIRAVIEECLLEKSDLVPNNKIYSRCNVLDTWYLTSNVKYAHQVDIRTHDLVPKRFLSDWPMRSELGYFARSLNSGVNDGAVTLRLVIPNTT